MKKALLVMAGLFFLAAATVAQATPVTIMDNYYGGGDYYHSGGSQDLIGTAEGFDTTKMEVSFFDNAGVKGFYIDIYSRYLNNIGTLNTQLGDLFISTDGWSPYGSQPYGSDTMYNGENWELAVVLDNHLSSSGGTAKLYDTTAGGTIKSSNSYFSGSGYRHDQEVQFVAGGLGSLAVGSWTINYNNTSADTDDYLRIAIGYDFGDAADFGFHWAMTCGNDVIEGGAKVPGGAVPEPATMLLFGTGLAGLAGMARRRRKE